jgi:hypothetical protein
METVLWMQKEMHERMDGVVGEREREGVKGDEVWVGVGGGRGG